MTSAATGPREKGVNYVDAGTSGGIWGLQVGYCLMVGGDERREAARADSSSRSHRRAATCMSAGPAPAIT